MSINSIIPFHHKSNLKDYIKTRSIILGITAIAIGQFLIAIAFLVLQSNVVELFLNLTTAIYALVSIYFLRYFRTIESYLNIVLSGFYIYLFALIIINGGLLSDAIFWLALLLLLSIFFTQRNHTYFWAAVVFIFITSLYAASLMGVKLVPPVYDETYRMLNLATFFSPLIISGLVFSSTCRKNSVYQNKLVDRMERLKSQQNDLIYEITHDLKSPTNRILGLIQIFDKSNLRQEQLEIIELIKQTNDSSNRMINSLLNTPAYDFETKELIDLKVTFEYLEKTYKAAANGKDIELYFDVQENLAVVNHRFDLIRVFDNIISNAIKFSRLGSKVEIRAFKINGFIKVQATDSGPGFSCEDIDFIFDKSIELTAKPTGNESSHGLGLHIVHKLSKKLGIEVELIESSSLGSTFEIIIPI